MKNDFADFFEEIAGTNPYDPSKYGIKTLVGVSFGKKSQLAVQYLLGNAFVDGYIGERKVRVFFKENQGYQVYLSATSKFADRATHSFPPHARDKKGAFALRQSAARSTARPCAP